MGYDVPGSQYLYRRDSGIYFIRLCVPRRLQSAVGKGEIHRSTGCRDLQLAKIVAAELAVEWHRGVRALDHMDITTIAAGSVQLLGEGYVPLCEAAQALGTSPKSLAERLIARRAPLFVRADDWLGWRIEDYHAQLDHLPNSDGSVEVVIDERTLGGLEARVRHSGMLAIRFDDEGLAVAGSAVPVWVCQFLALPSRSVGFLCDLPGQALTVDMLQVRRTDAEALRLDLSSRLSPDLRAAVLGGMTAAATTKLTCTPAGKTVGDLATEYLGRHKGAWKPDQTRRRNDQLNLLLDLLGNIPLSQIDRSKMRGLADLIARIPDERHNVKRKYNCPSASFRELIALADAHNLPRLTTHAQSRLLDSLGEIFTWAVSETMMPMNPSKGLGAEVVKRAGGPKVKEHEQREAFSDEQLRLIFSASWFQNGVGQRTAKGLFHGYRPHYYWLPLLALFAGGRLNELAQLYLRDIRVDGSGIAYLDFNLEGADKMDLDRPEAAPDKSLKTVNAQRAIPIHDFLVQRGFLEYVEALRNAGHTRLFPELKFDRTKGYGKAAGSWFNERYLGIKLKIVRNGLLTFHSLRHHFATALGAAELPTTLKSDLMGHSRSKALVESRYDKGGSLAQFKEGVDKLSYRLPPIAKFNVNEGLEAIKHAIKLKASHK